MTVAVCAVAYLSVCACVAVALRVVTGKRTSGDLIMAVIWPWLLVTLAIITLIRAALDERSP